MCVDSPAQDIFLSVRFTEHTTNSKMPRLVKTFQNFDLIDVTQAIV